MLNDRTCSIYWKWHHHVMKSAIIGFDYDNCDSFKPSRVAEYVKNWGSRSTLAFFRIGSYDYRYIGGCLLPAFCLTKPRTDMHVYHFPLAHALRGHARRQNTIIVAVLSGRIFVVSCNGPADCIPLCHKSSGRWLVPRWNGIYIIHYKNKPKIRARRSGGKGGLVHHNTISCRNVDFDQYRLTCERATC